MHTLDIYRAGVKFTTINLDGGQSNTQNKTVMGENFISLSFVLNKHEDFHIGDYCTVFGEKYLLNDLPVVNKKSTFRFEYSVKMVAEGADLAKIMYLQYGPTNQLTEVDFSVMGNAQDMMKLLVDNANRVQPGQWTLGQVAVTPYKNISFSRENCYNALSKLAEEFGTEFWIIGKTVHLVPIVNDKGYLFKHGRNKGLYTIQRQSISNASVITRLYAFGSEKNLPAGYGSTRLRLPAITDPCLVSNMEITNVDAGGGNDTYTFKFTPAAGAGVTTINIQYRKVGTTPWTGNAGGNVSPRTLTLPKGAFEFKFQSFGGACTGAETGVISGPTLTTGFPYIPTFYIENNVAQYGLIEYTEYFEDVYPHRTGKVTSVNAANVFQFVDSSMNFDINQYRVPGAEPKITFNTGQLAGYTFDIAAYNDSTKLFTILKNKEERSLDMPSDSFKPAIGDDYVLTDIQMPQSYIVAAETELLAKATAFLKENSVPQVAYNVDIDPLFMKRVKWSVSIGDTVTVKDDDFGINKKIRIVNVTRDLVSEDKYAVQLADKVTPNKLAVLITQSNSNSSGIQGINQTLQNAAIFNNTIIGDLKLVQGTVVAPNMPQSTAAGLPIYYDVATGNFYVKI